MRIVDFLLGFGMSVAESAEKLICDGRGPALTVT
jgi:hypothetical protein